MRKPIRSLGVAMVLLLVAACGNRLSDEEFARKASTAEQADAPADDDGAADQVTDGATDSAATDGAATSDGAIGVIDVGSPTGGSTDGTVTGSGGDTTGTGTGSGTTGGPSGPNRASDVGITPTSIVLGTIVAENGVLGDAFAPSARGLRAWTAAQNARGGINGRQIVLKTCDDGEVRAKALACAQRLVEQDKVFALVGVNTRALGGAAQYLDDQGVPVIGMPITNSFYRYPHFWGTYPYAYARDGKTVGFQGKLVFHTAIYRWFKENLKVTKAAVFSYDIPESKQAGESFAQGLRLEGFQVTSYTVSFAAPSFDQAVASMQQDGTQLVLDTMDDGANRKLCDAMARRQFKVVAKVSTIVTMGDNVGKAYNDTCRNSVYVPGSSIPYTEVSVPEVKRFRDAFARYQPGKPLHQWALEAWGQANTVADGITKMGAAPTRKGLEDHFRSLDNSTAGGIYYDLDWKVPDYASGRTTGCTTIAKWDDSKGGWVQATQQFPVCYPNMKTFTGSVLEQGN